MGNLWIRALGAGVAVILTALLLKVAPPILVLAVFVGGIAFVFVNARRRAREPLDGGGADLRGLRREAGDPFGILGYPLTLFGRAGDPEIDELVWGRWRGIDVHTFVLSFAPPSPTGEVRGRATFACAMATIDGSLPGLVLEPQTFLTLLQAVPPGAAIDIGEAGFDAAVNVWTDDEEYARRMLDEPARDWLRSLDQHWGLEIRGRIAMIYGPKPDRPDLVANLEILRDLLERLPEDIGVSGTSPA
jgi:hypothetical protein